MFPAKRSRSGTATKYGLPIDLLDGTQIKAKFVVSAIARLEEYKESGDPVYIVNAQVVLSTSSPDELKKKVE